MAGTFWSDFLASLASDFIVFALGILTAWLVGKKLNIWEQTQERKRLRTGDIVRAVRYLQKQRDVPTAR